MTCPECGYVLAAFDKECPRCRRFQRSERSCPHCGTVNAASAPDCKRCGHTFQSHILHGQKPALRPPPPGPPATEQEEEPPTPLRVAPAPPPAPAPLQGQPHSLPQGQPSAPLSTPLTAEMLACRMCGSTGGQKLTAICRAGSWTTQSRGYAVGVGGDGYGNTVMVGGPTSSTSHGQTALAALLLPPNRPVFRPSRVGSILVPLIGGLVSLVASTAGPLPASVAVLLTCALWFVVLLSEGRAAADGLARHGASRLVWEQAMQTWGRLFYCSRCDHVYDPQEGTAAAPTAMNTLLFGRSAGLRPVHEAADDGAVVKAASLAFGVAALLLAWIWVANAQEQGREGEEVRQVSQVRDPLLARYRAALPTVDAAIAQGERAMGVDTGGDAARAEQVSQLSTHLSELKSSRDAAQQAVDDLGKPEYASIVQDEAAQARSAIDGMQESCRSVTGDLQGLDRPVVLAAPWPPPKSVNSTGTPPGSPQAPADAGTGGSYSITTEAGGGTPPDPALLPHGGGAN